jgi:hypothetical protein
MIGLLITPPSSHVNGEGEELMIAWKRYEATTRAQAGAAEAERASAPPLSYAERRPYHDLRPPASAPTPMNAYPDPRPPLGDVRHIYPEHMRYPEPTRYGDVPGRPYGEGGRYYEDVRGESVRHGDTGQYGDRGRHRSGDGGIRAYGEGPYAVGGRSYELPAPLSSLKSRHVWPHSFVNSPSSSSLRQPVPGPTLPPLRLPSEDSSTCSVRRASISPPLPPLLGERGPERHELAGRRHSVDYHREDDLRREDAWRRGSPDSPPPSSSSWQPGRGSRSPSAARRRYTPYERSNAAEHQPMTPTEENSFPSQTSTPAPAEPGSEKAEEPPAVPYRLRRVWEDDWPGSKHRID